MLKGPPSATPMSAQERPRKACEALGAERAINYREEDFVELVKAATDGEGVVLDMVGGDYIQRAMARDLRVPGSRDSKVPVPVSVRALHVGQGLTDVGDQFQGRRSSRRFTGWPSVMRLRTSLR